MSTMASVYQRDLKRVFLNDEDDPLPTTKKIKRVHNYRQQWCVRYHSRRKKRDDDDEVFHCQVYLKLFPATCKCMLEVIVKSTNNEIVDDDQSILLARTRIGKPIPAGVIRVRLVSSLFAADADVQEDPSLIKLETMGKAGGQNSFDKQFALQLKNDRIGPGVIGKLFVESLDPSNGSYTSGSPIFELNLSLASEQRIRSTSPNQDREQVHQCGCQLSSDETRLFISDQCNLKFNDTKLVHRLAEALRCQWKPIGRELAPCFSDTDLLDIQQTYLTSDGNHECAYQLLREWYIRDPQRANVRSLTTRLKLPLEIIVKIHDEIVRTFVHS